MRSKGNGKAPPSVPPRYGMEGGAWKPGASWKCPLLLRRMQKKKSPENVVFSRLFTFGGDKRDRTADLLNAIQALSQLSYTPKCSVLRAAAVVFDRRRQLL